MSNLAQLRTDLAAARITLRQAKDELETAKAIAEQNYIMTLGGNVGKNSEERERNLIIGLSGSSLYRDALSYLRESEASIDQLQAEIAIEEDRLRAEELRVREKLADALLGRRESTATDDRASLELADARAYASQNGAINDWYEP
jgi:hypothetical protein